MGYWRGGGVYMSNGYLEIEACTIVENEVRGVPRTDSLGRRNLAGGVAATVGNAHATEHLILGHSIVAGNTVEEIGGDRHAHDVFTGSLFYFRSAGYNRIGVLDFSQMLVPVGESGWASLSRKHYPKAAGPGRRRRGRSARPHQRHRHSTSVLSVGVGAGEFAVLHYARAAARWPRYPRPATRLRRRWPSTHFFGRHRRLPRDRARAIESRYALPGFAAAFTADFEAFLRSADCGPATDGVQPYRTPAGDPILTLAATNCGRANLAEGTREPPVYRVLASPGRRARGRRHPRPGPGTAR